MRATILTFCLAAALQAAAPLLIPRPARIEARPGTWTLRPQTRIAAAGAALAEAEKLSLALAAPLGRALPVVPRERPGDIVFRLDESRADLADEGYELAIDRDFVRIAARRPAGLFYGAQTFRQLLPPAAWRAAPTPAADWTAPCVRIADQPRFAWRGLLLDPARHFLAKAALKQMIDAMAMHKLNRLQLHLTDDQGWRIELQSFPLLTARSSWRDGTLAGHLRRDPESYTSVPHGGYYSREDIREIVAYAAARHIAVVPEIEMPGHARAWLSAYPEYAVFPDRARGMDLWKRWGVSKDVLAPRPETVRACFRILDEICELFPSPWIHTGGDEAPRDQWRESPEMQQLIRKLGLRNEDELQAWFTAQLSRHLAAKGRRLVGWDEILHGAQLGSASAATTALAPNAVVMSWRGEKGGREASAAGHDVIMAPNQWTYLDYLQGPRDEEPLGIGGSVSLARAHAYDPVPEGLPKEAAARILGAQAQVWSEYLPGFDAVAYMTFPRASALAESFWSPPEGKDLRDFITRLEHHEARLQAIGIPYRPLTRRVSWYGSSGAVRAEAKDAVVHGTEISRQPDGALGGWKDPYTTIAWRVRIPVVGRYEVKLDAAGPAALEAIIGGQALRVSTDQPALFDAAAPGPYLVVLRTPGAPGPDGIPAIRGLEFAPVRSADLKFHPADGGAFWFDTGVLKGVFRLDGRSSGLIPVVHLPSGIELARSMGLFGVYRVFGNGRRIVDGMWSVPSEARAAADGSVEVRWPAAAERPYEMRAVYRWSGPASLDVEISVHPEAELRGFETFLATYWGEKLTDSAVLTRDGRFTPADKASGIWQMFPRDAGAAALVRDGRWKLPPHPVDWVVRPEFERCLGIRRDPASGLTAAVMSPAGDCFAVATPHQGEQHYSLYLSLFGRDLKKGETARARARIVVLASPGEDELRKLRIE